ncbi:MULTISPECIES: histidine phosphatase family protein [unclassified Sphingomonas]|uniref:histidine phosphatase family protein n=1 Tax=unclassified Sphingomonas TaxID=196159 RepID=UPI0025ED088A|nr:MULTISPECIES: histidine phosphatase family protein [unclassified Sphingomonas]
MTARVLLVRHTAVAKAWSGRCYGRSDMGLSRAGAVAMRALAADLAAQSFATIVHSGAIRTRLLAGRIARLTGRPLLADPRWLERDFGTWEGRRWHAIWRETGDLMDRMMTDPAGFYPGGGESGQDLATRARAAWDALPTDADTLVVSHGGPIAAIRTLRAGQPLERTIDAVPPCGSWLALPRQGRA